MNQRAMQELFEEFCNSILDKDMERFMELFDEEACFEYPYAPSGLEKIVKGKEAIDRHFKPFPQQFDIARFSEPTYHFTMDPNVMIVEFEVMEGRVVSTQNPYLQKYISVIQTRNNKIVYYKDYWNPLIALEAMQDKASHHKSIEGEG